MEQYIKNRWGKFVLTKKVYNKKGTSLLYRIKRQEIGEKQF